MPTRKCAIFQSEHWMNQVSISVIGSSCAKVTLAIVRRHIKRPPVVAAMCLLAVFTFIAFGEIIHDADVTQYEIPGMGNDIAWAMTVGPDGALWFTQTGRK